MKTIDRQFEEEWVHHKPELRHYFLTRGVIQGDVDDHLQNVARNLWHWCCARDSLPENFFALSKRIATNLLIDARRAEARRPKLEFEPIEYFEKIEAPFADLWGREVPSTRWNFAEEVSVAPLAPSEPMKALPGLSAKEHQIVYYLAQGRSLQELSTLLDMPLDLLQYRLGRIGRRLQQKVSSTIRRQYGFQIEPIPKPSWPPISLPIQKLDATNYLRKLPGYVPEWVTWFSWLSTYINENDEPITFGVIQRLARETGTLHEEQGRRFLLAATSDKGALLSQRFYQLMPQGEPRLLSYSDIYELLGKQSSTEHEAAVSGAGRLDQIATAWEPTMKWAELRSW